MKPKFLLKGAIVAMAAFGAFAFNGNANDQASFTRSDTCSNIIAECDVNGDEKCYIEVSNDIVPVMDLLCEEQVNHTDSNPVLWH